jgi:hypothetical protein
LVEVLTERLDYFDLPEVYLPEQRIVCNVSSEFVPTKDDPVKTQPVARAFTYQSSRNHDREGHERPTERLTLPSDLVCEIRALADLTARQRELAGQVGARIAALVPLDAVFELDHLRNEMEVARSRGAAAETINDINARLSKVHEDWTIDQAHRYRDLRSELATLVAPR